MSGSDKDTEYYAASVNAWFSTKLEHDKSLIALATGGIGLLVTLVSTVGVKSVESLVLHILAIVSFLICVGAVLWIFNRNATHLKEIIKDQAHADPVLGRLDFIAIVSFCAGVVLSSIIGISQAANSFLLKEKEMAQETKSQRGSVRDSFNGASSIKPDSAEFTKSFDGAAALKPSSPQSGGASQTTGAGAAQDQGQGSNQGQGQGQGAAPTQDKGSSGPK